MDINNLNRVDIHKYTYQGEYDQDSAKNKYPEDWTIPASPSEFECEDDHSNDRFVGTALHHFGCCHCGCGSITYSTYAPGHDQKHYGKLIRQWQQADTKEAMQLIRDAQDYTSDGVWSKLIDRTGFKVGPTTDGRYAATGRTRDMVVKVGRWYYPVVKHPVTLTFYRSTKTVSDRFHDGHEFTIKVNVEDVTSLTDLRIAQEKAGA